jgi:hypothetical protein
MVQRVGVLLESREFPCDFFLWGYMKDFIYSTSVNTIEVLRERVENVATTIRNNRGIRIISSASSLLYLQYRRSL